MRIFLSFLATLLLLIVNRIFPNINRRLDMPNYGMCGKCLEVKHLHKHHIYPKRHFKNQNIERFPLCRSCHDELEKMIPFRKLKNKHDYVKILAKFLRDDKRRGRKW